VRLEDAFLYFVADPGAATGDGTADVCRAAIQAGADVIQVGPWGRTDPKVGAAVLDACREEGALLVVGGDAQLAASIGADGVRVDAAEGGIGRLRQVLGEGALVGMTTFTADEARMAVSAGVDYIVHEAGGACCRDFASIGAGAGVPIFAGGLAGLEQAREVVGGGVFRLCVRGLARGARETKDEVAAYARLLGRVI
jgi:thiamine monophosphate synthase